jgi:asparagine synthase (glutamine-hydrolysing)
MCVLRLGRAAANAVCRARRGRYAALLLPRGPGWFGFASEIKGLLALPQIERRLNDSRVLDYLVPEFDRDDEVGTFLARHLRLPPGMPCARGRKGVKTWRWWQPGAAGATALRLAGRMHRGLHGPALIRDDRENCADWQSIQAILQADPWLQPTVLTTAKVDEVWEQLLALAAQADDPFAFGNGMTYHLTYQAAREVGCGVLLDGMAGDMLFHDGRGTLEALVRRRLWGLLPGLRQAYRNHQWTGGLTRDLVLMAARVHQPDWVRSLVRRRRDDRRITQGDLSGLPPGMARAYLDARRTPAYREGDQTWQPDEVADHAQRYTSGLNSFGHETYGPLAFACGVEPRSPYSDRRLIEFGITMPLEAKLAIPWYKQLLRASTESLLPQATRERRDVGEHPGWTYFDRLARRVLDPASAGVSEATGYDKRHAQLRRYLLGSWRKSRETN